MAPPASVTGYAVPVVLRTAGRFVPREHVGSRAPQRVTAGAFTSRNLPVPSDRREWNSYQLSGRQGWEWSEPIDRHTSRIGSELLPHGTLVLVDLDVTGDGSGIADLAALTSSLGVDPDFTGAVVVASPGHGSHQPGRHLWWRADPSLPVKFGALAGWPRIEVKSRGTCPGSPGYRVLAEPRGELAMLPRWLARVAGPPVAAVPADRNAQLRVTHGRPAARLAGIVSRLLEADDGRNELLFWCGARCGDMIRSGELERDVAENMLLLAATECGYIAKHGASAALATIRSGFRSAAAA